MRIFIDPPALVAELGCVTPGPPAFELPPAVPPALCATAHVLASANAAARTTALIFMAVSSCLTANDNFTAGSKFQEGRDRRGTRQNLPSRVNYHAGRAFRCAELAERSFINIKLPLRGPRRGIERQLFSPCARLGLITANQRRVQMRKTILALTTAAALAATAIAAPAEARGWGH